MKRRSMFLVPALIFSCLLLSACGSSDTSSQTGAWKSASLAVNNAGLFSTRVDGNGTVFSVWGQSTGLYANQYTGSSGWGTSQKICEPSPAAGWADLQFAVSKNGHAVATWYHGESGNMHVEAVRYVAGSGWGAVENLGNIGEPRDIAINDEGKIFLVAEDIADRPKGITVAQYDPAGGWTNHQLVYADQSTGLGYPRIAIDGSGNGFVLWVEGYYDVCVYASRYSQSGWGAPVKIAPIAGTSVAWTNIALGNNGEAMALWGQRDSLAYHTYACHYTTANGWGSSQQIENLSSNGSFDQFLTVSPSGNFYAIWTQRTDSSLNDIYSSEYSPANGWGIPQLVGTNGTARYPKIAADAHGNVFAAWQQYEPNSSDPGDANVYSNRLKAGTGWGTQQQLKGTAGGADSPQLVVDKFGNATVMWSQTTSSSTSSIFFSRFE